MVVTHSLADSRSLVGPPYLNNKKTTTNNYYHCLRSMHSKEINIQGHSQKKKGASKSHDHGYMHMVYKNSGSMDTLYYNSLYFM